MYLGEIETKRKNFHKGSRTLRDCSETYSRLINSVYDQKFIYTLLAEKLSRITGLQNESHYPRT